MRVILGARRHMSAHNLSSGRFKSYEYWLFYIRPRIWSHYEKSVGYCRAPGTGKQSCCEKALGCQAPLHLRRLDTPEN